MLKLPGRFIFMMFLSLLFLFLAGCPEHTEEVTWQEMEKESDTLAKEGKYEESLILLKKTVNKLPDSEKNRIYLKIHEREYEYKVEVAKNYVFNQRYTDAYLFARDYLTTQEYRKALTFFFLVKESNPYYDNGIVYFSIVNAYLSMANYDEALKYWAEGRSTVWNRFADLFKSRYLQLKAKILLQKGDYKEIPSIIEEANSFHLLEENCYIAGLSEYRQNKIANAKAWLIKALDKKPGYNEAENLLMEIVPYSTFVKEDLFEKAGIPWNVRKLFQDGINEFDNYSFEVSHELFFQALLKKSTIEILFRNWSTEEVTVLEKKLSDQKTSAKDKTRILLTLANLNHYIIGNGSAAKDYYLALLKNDPENFEGYLNYGVIVQKERKFDIAFENLKKAVQLNPNSGRANFFLGLNFLKIGNIENGYSHLNKAMKLSKVFTEEVYTKMILEELKGFIPYDQSDVEIIKKYSVFFDNSKEQKEEFEEILKKFVKM